MAGKPQRNDPCPCGSGKKYKHCCLGKTTEKADVGKDKILQIKVNLTGIEPAIWRRLLVRGESSLGEFHYILQASMGWDNAHLHEFLHEEGRYGPPDPEASYEILDEDDYSLDSILCAEGMQIEYLYDFGDGWMHEVVLEKVLEPEPGQEYPHCLEGERACPPEDSGGVHGYFNIIEAMAQPENEEHRELLDWVGEDFDPEHFDPREVNVYLPHAESWWEYLDEDDDEDDEEDWEDFTEEVYDADKDADPEEWLAMDEGEQHLWVGAYHALKKPHDLPPDPEIHSIMHVVAETWLAADDPPEARPALARLIAEGLTRHEAIHAIAMVFADQIWEINQGRKPSNEEISRKLAGLDRASWEKGQLD